MQVQLNCSPIPVEFVDAVPGSALREHDIRAWLSDEGYRLHLARAGSECADGSCTVNSVGLMQSYFLAFDRIDALQEPVLIFEDDAVICDHFFERLREVVSHTPADADLIYCSWNPHPWVASIPTRHRDVERIVRRLHGTGAIIFMPRAIPFIRKLKPFDLQIDHEIPDKLILTKQLKAYRVWSRGERLVTNDNFGGTTVQI
jgi:hypothetical protein